MTLFDGITVYDGVMALIVFFTCVHGFWKGAAWQVAPIMSLVLGYMIAMPMSVTTAHYFGDPPQNRLFALVSIYIAVSLVVYLMVRSFRAGIEKAKLTEFDRHIGAMLGFVKGILLTLAITVVMLISSPVARDLILKSESSTIAAKIINTVYPILPQAMHQILQPYLKQLGNELPLDIHDDLPASNGGGSGGNLLPDYLPGLLPTNSTARRDPNQNYVPNPRTRARSTIEQMEDELPVSPMPRQRKAPSTSRTPQARRNDYSAARSSSRYSADDGYSSDSGYSAQDRQQYDSRYSTSDRNSGGNQNATGNRNSNSDRYRSNDRYPLTDRNSTSNRYSTSDRDTVDDLYSADPQYPSSNNRVQQTVPSRATQVPVPMEEDDPFVPRRASRDR